MSSSMSPPRRRPPSPRPSRSLGAGAPWWSPAPRGGADAPGFHPDDLVGQELRVFGALGVDRDDYVAALELLATGRYPFADLPREVVGLDQAAGLLARMAGESGPPPPVHGVVAP